MRERRHPTKKILSFLLAASLLTTFGFGQTSGPRFSLKLSGGMGYHMVGELNSAMVGESDYNYASMSNVSGRYEKMHWTANANLEAVFHTQDSLEAGPQ